MQNRSKLFVGGAALNVEGISVTLTEAKPHSFKFKVITEVRPHGWVHQTNGSSFRVRNGGVIVTFRPAQIEKLGSGVDAIFLEYSVQTLVNKRKLGQVKRRQKRREASQVAAN